MLLKDFIFNPFNNVKNIDNAAHSFFLHKFQVNYLLGVNFFHKEKPTTFLLDVKDGKITVFQGRIWRGYKNIK